MSKSFIIVEVLCYSGGTTAMIVEGKIKPRHTSKFSLLKEAKIELKKIPKNPNFVYIIFEEIPTSLGKFKKPLHIELGSTKHSIASKN